jgi:hypothetical protein
MSMTSEQERNKTICQAHAPNLETLRRAFHNGDVCLMECEVNQPILKGEVVAALCAASRDGAAAQFTPVALLFSRSPYEFLNPPNPDGGFLANTEPAS